SCFRSLAGQAEAANAACATLGTELACLAAVSWRLQRSVRRLEGQQELQHSVHSQPSASEGEAAAVTSCGGSCRDCTAHSEVLGTFVLVAVTECCFPTPVCSVGSVLLFSNTSPSDGAVLQPRLHVGLWELSLCTWMLTLAPHLGTVLSYIHKAEGSKLALHGDQPGSAHFVIGDTEFRQLLVTPPLDGNHGQYRFYVDRRLLTAGSGFQQGYDVPAGGSLALGGQQQSGGFEPFLGKLAGLALWSRALLPGEVASMATGQGLPHGPPLMLADATLQGEVHRERCACLQHCP
uniref:Pentraxin (PTX) domain-containing protein n=1 Tax=Pavo cristatus TaxID=9049 RepID=A0A8C9FA98_PAVCR